MPPNEDMRELLRLTRENNKLLHKARRAAIWGGIIKFLLYTGVLVLLPLWIYSTYLAPVVQQITNTYEEIQGTGARANAQFSDFGKMLEDFRSNFSQ